MANPLISPKIVLDNVTLRFYYRIELRTERIQ
jgi:hypothetical protein